MINCNENEAENEKYIKKIWHKDLSLHMDLNILKYKMHLSIIMLIYIEQHLSTFEVQFMQKVRKH